MIVVLACRDDHGYCMHDEGDNPRAAFTSTSLRGRSPACGSFEGFLRHCSQARQQGSSCPTPSPKVDVDVDVAAAAAAAETEWLTIIRPSSRTHCGLERCYLHRCELRLCLNVYGDVLPLASNFCIWQSHSARKGDIMLREQSKAENQCEGNIARKAMGVLLFYIE